MTIPISEERKEEKEYSRKKKYTPVVKPVTTDKKDKVVPKKVIKKRPVRAEVNEEEVQKQIKETLARLTTKGKSKGSRYRREKREAYQPETSGSCRSAWNLTRIFLRLLNLYQ